MGVCYGDENTREINSRMQQALNCDVQLHKLLFLGPGGSGKSTIFKQLKYLHLDGFSNQDANSFKPHIYSQITEQMKLSVQFYDRWQVVGDDNREQKELQTLQESIDFVMEFEPIAPNLGSNFSAELADAITYIWENDPKIKNAFTDQMSAQSKFLDETTEYFWNELRRIKQPNYIPNETDIIKVRYRTCGVHQEEFWLDGKPFLIVDVGGQKSERKKWIHCFSEVKAVIFVVSLSCYNEVMFEDMSQNAMVDALRLFDETINHKAFHHTHIILFLNKTDLFKEKIKQVPITDCPVFTDFAEFKPKHASRGQHGPPDPHSYRTTASYVKHKFEVCNRNPKKEIFGHLTCGLSQQNIKDVFCDVTHIVVTANIASQGLY
eukprot:CAMPEP_0202697534 /NCGR_PEP_ID=MMETSP1385-20130828/10878_1 /ASSEMBLY_ACC=CAM_ASM_000861 /TAXON_ID=933848 /ORGANISM="Elphidium margaritaceum" /LENGTH=377 /DNA_ID=CAMNT_0049354023 /DNA_START=49 /DNA_END=1182 /DNA_ORIENTATION=-